MKDINFFDSYIVKKKVKINKGFIFILSAIAFLLVIIAFIISNQLRIIKLSKDIATSKGLVEDGAVVEKMEEVSMKEDELNFLKENIAQLIAYNKYIEMDNTIHYSILEMLASSVPQDVFLTSISLYPEVINIVGKAKNELLVAELMENIEVFKPFMGVFLSSITKEDQFYSFILDINLKEVINGGEDILQEEPED
ncbi:MAG: PilN domain-containing protein [Tissierellia bacterium]|nr:PilN domain-containing protein [Tissierellia bacterium]